LNEDPSSLMNGTGHIALSFISVLYKTTGDQSGGPGPAQICVQRIHTA
jgi:hypothetical protein